MRKNDVIKWRARLKLVTIEKRIDQKQIEYFMIRTERGSRVLSWDRELMEYVTKDIENNLPSIWICEGYVNQVIGNSFLVMVEAEKLNERVCQPYVFLEDINQ